MARGWPTGFAALSLLVLPLLATACLHWVPEEDLEPDDDDGVPDDDDAIPDDDDAVPDDDDAVPDDDDAVPVDTYEADAIGLLMIMDDRHGEPTGQTIGGALFSEALLAPSAEEALVEELFDSSWPLFAEPGEPRQLSPGDHYDVVGTHVGDALFLNAGADSAALSWTGAGYLPEAGLWLPDLLGSDTGWVLQVPAGGSGFSGFHEGAPLPEPAEPEFSRMVDSRVHLLAGEHLSGDSASGGGAWDLLLLRTNEDSAAVAFRVEANGAVGVNPDDLPPGMVEGGWAQLAWYRAERVRHDLDGGLLRLVTARWTELELRFLAGGVGYAWTDPPELPAGVPLVFTVLLEEAGVPLDDPPQVMVGGLAAPTVSVASDHELEVSFPDGLYGAGLQDLLVSWTGGAAQGSALLVAEPLSCGLTETEPNDLPSQAQFFIPGVVACGTTDPPTDVDSYRFSAAEGDTLVFETLANRLGLPTDTTLSLQDMAGAELDFNDDGFEDGSWDSLLIWEAQAAGQYLLRVASYENQVGGPGYDYQLITSVE